MKQDPILLLWLHKIVSSLKALIAGTFHDLGRKHFQRYFNEFAYRFNLGGNLNRNFFTPLESLSL